MAVKFDQTHRGVVAGLRQRDRRPAHGRRRAAQHQRRGWTDGEPAHHPVAARQRFQRAVEPAGLHPARTGKAALEHVLSIEMRTVAIRCRHRMDHRRMFFLIHPCEFRHRGMQRKEGIQRCRCVRAIGGQRDRTMQAGIIGVADRRHGGEAVERAAQDHDNQPRVAPVGGAGEFRQIGPGCERCAAEQQRAP